MKALVSWSLGVWFLGTAFGISISVKMAWGAVFLPSQALNGALPELQSFGCDKRDQGMYGSGLIILLWWSHLLFFCFFSPHVLDSDCISTKGKILLENYKYFPGYPEGLPCRTSHLSSPATWLPCDLPWAVSTSHNAPLPLHLWLTPNYDIYHELNEWCYVEHFFLPLGSHLRIMHRIKSFFIH